MEGHPCSQPGCRLNDFLPFFCPRCQHMYCLDHRSRFYHTCTADTESGRQTSIARSSPLPPSHSQPLPAGSQREHYAVRTSQTFQPALSDQEIHNRQRVASLSRALDSIAFSTRRVLVRRLAQALDRAPPHEDDRIYLIVHGIPRLGIPETFDDDAEYLVCLFLFTRRSASIDDLLRGLQDKGCFPDRHKVCVATKDCPEPRHFRRLESLGNQLVDGDELYVLHLQDLHPATAASAVSSISANSHQRVFVKGDAVFYFSPPPGEVVQDAERAAELRIALSAAEVIAVHHDDYPNIYYTIRLQERERQTDGLHLLPRQQLTLPVRPPADNAELERLGSTMRRGQSDLSLIQVALQCQGREVNLQVSASASLQELAQFSMLAFSLAQVKLIYKGKLLKNLQQSLAQAKIPSNARLMVMGH